jgi:hypothetical protein
MKIIRLALAAILGGLLCTVASAGTGAQVYCWAPGLTSTILLDSYGQGIGAYAGRPYSYNIYGVAGTLTLGNQLPGGVGFADPNDAAHRFRSGSWLGALGGYITSYSCVKIQVNWAQYYPQRLEIRGDRPGITTGKVRKYGTIWNTVSMFGYPETTIVFFLAGQQDDPVCNANPNGYFYVVGEYNATAPTVTGSLSVTSGSVLRGGTTPVGFTFNRGGSTTGQTPSLPGYSTAGEVVFLAGS